MITEERLLWIAIALPLVVLISLAAKQALNVIVRRRRQRRLDAEEATAREARLLAVKAPDATELLNMPETDADRRATSTGAPQQSK